MNAPIRRSPLCHRFPRTERLLELGFLLPLSLSIAALARVAGLV